MSSTTELTPGLTPGTWRVDPSHSTIGFVARHLMVTKVRGRFESFDGTLTVGDDPLQSKVEASVDMKSVSTGDAGRDGHLVGDDFFDVDQYPTMQFTSTSITPDGGDYALHGDLTIKGVTKPVTFALEFEGVATDPWGNAKAAFSASTEINRRDFGLDWNVALDQGGMLVSEKIKVELDVQAVKA
ncbi:MAG: YceI family protein [Actinobacteria bacterium]|nr:YceI family protein [Actinomycetota bacterium]